jgi:hypothetical protein
MSVAFHRAEPSGDLRTAGWLLVILPLLSLLALAHHPTTAAHNAHEAMSQLAGIVTAAQVVHGALIAMQCGMLYALLSWLVSRNLLRAVPRAAAIMLLLGTVGVIGAALVDGFIVAPLATYPHDGDPNLAIMDQLIRFSMTLNQVLILAGESAMSAGIALVSIDLLSSERGGRWVGSFGLVLGSVSLVALLTGLLVLHLHGMHLLFAAQSLWMLGLGTFILRPVRQAAYAPS